jgi:two-component system sensor histidine kinase HupT/HoxJ
MSKSARPDFRILAELPAELPMVGSAGQIQQVAMNLIENARDATADLAHPRLEISARIEGQHIVLAFRDNGPGVSEALQSQIFDPFFTTKPVGKGTGLGLAISYGIVERHGGRLTVTNHPEGGAVFELVLPLAAK